MANQSNEERCAHEAQMACLVDRYQAWRRYQCPYCEIERLRTALGEITTMDGEQARHAAECALRNHSALQETPRG